MTLMVNFAENFIDRRSFMKSVAGLSVWIAIVSRIDAKENKETSFLDFSFELTAFDNLSPQLAGKFMGLLNAHYGAKDFENYLKKYAQLKSKKHKDPLSQFTESREKLFLKDVLSLWYVGYPLSFNDSKKYVSVEAYVSARVFSLCGGSPSGVPGIMNWHLPGKV